MKKIIKILVLFFLSLTLVSCDLLDGINGDNKNSMIEEIEDLPTVEEVVYIGSDGTKKEYLLYFSDGSSQVIYIKGEDDLPVKDITIDDLYQAAIDDGFTGSMNDFILEFVNVDVNEPKEAIVKGLKSTVSIFAHFTETKRTTPIIGLPEITKNEYTSAGSGIIYILDKETGTAYIVTNHHVIYDANSDTSNKISDDIDIYLYGLELEDYKIDGTFVGGTETHDVAVIKVENSEILKNSIAEAAVFADSEFIEAGDTAIAIGNAQARGISVTKGIISVISENIDMDTNNLGLVNFRVIRIDTAVNKGNSGGGLFNNKGEVIGIVNAKMVSESVDSIGYALPSNMVYNVAENIRYYCDNKNQEKPLKVLIGVTMKINSRIVSYDEVTDKILVKDIIKVEDITPDSPASEHFIKGDEIVSVVIDNDTYIISRLHQLSDLLFKVKRNKTVIFTVIRDGNLIDLEITFKNNNFNLVS